MADLLDDSVETVMFVRGVIDDALGAIGFDQGVGSLDLVTVTGLPGLLVITGVWVFYGITVFVVGWCLWEGDEGEMGG